MTNDKFTNKLTHWALILQEYKFKLFTDLVLHIKTQIPCRGNPHYLWRFLRNQVKLRLNSNSTCILCIKLFYTTIM
jgi:hypothetical protein